jgi:putative transposase
MAAYIELNAVRAGIVRDPKDYRWCGYGEAIMGSKQARKGIAALMKPLGIETSWKEQGREYRKHLYMQGRQKGAAPKGEQLRPGFSAEEVEQILLEGGKLPRHTILRCRVRYFSDGLVLGSQAFVESAYNRYRSQFGLKRKTGARAMKYGQWDGLATMRDLRKAVILVPVTV